MPRRYFTLALLATFAGAFLRLWQLTAVPPGLHYDLAATALLGNEVAFNGFRPVFITAYTGHEVLYYYWLALWFNLVGSSVFTLRLAAALLGVLAIPASFFALRWAARLFTSRTDSLLYAALGAAALAFAFFHVTFSRFGFRVISEPVVQALAVGFLLKGVWQTKRNLGMVISNSGRSVAHSRGLHFIPQLLITNHAFLLSGLFTGLAAYTYLAARLFPFPLAAFWLALLLGAARHKGALGRYALGFGTFTLAAVCAFAPLALYFWQHPADFLNRANQIVPRPGETELLLTGIRRAAEMLFINGEPYDRFNLPGLPMLDPILGFFFCIGLGLALRHAFARKTSREHRAVEILCLVWLPAMLVPTALSVHDIFPSNVRAFGLIPLLFLFPARGLVASYRWVQRLMPGPLIPRAHPLSWVCAFVLLAGTFNTYQNYFLRWANLPNQRLNNDTDLTTIATALNQQDLTATSVYVSTIHYRHPTFAYLARDFGQIHWLTGGTSLVIPQGRPALYAFALSALPPLAWIDAWDDHQIDSPVEPDGRPTYLAYRWAANETPPLPDFTPLNENFGNIATLTGVKIITPTANALQVDLRWRIENLIAPGDMLPYARLYDAWGYSWAQSGGFSYPSEQWQPGDTLLVRLTLPLPAGLPRGQYTLKAGMYSAGAQWNLPRLQANGAYGGERATVGQLTLSGGPNDAAAREQALLALSAPAQITGFDADLHFGGYQLPTPSPRQNQLFPLTLAWQAQAPLRPVAIIVRLGDTLLGTGLPVANTFPFERFAPGQFVLDRWAIRIPPDFPPGPAALSLEVPGYGHATLTTLDIQPVTRTFTAPVGYTPLAHNFGDIAALAGYRTDSHQLTLLWHSLAQTDVDYTVFVHILDATGNIVAQTDSFPQRGNAPTSLWLPGEYLTDPYTFDLAPGVYTVEIGLYLPEDGTRLGEEVVKVEWEVK